MIYRIFVNNNRKWLLLLFLLLLFGAKPLAGYSQDQMENPLRGFDLEKDTDGDGVKDVYDLDADNDGILNHLESPACFISHTEIESGDRQSLFDIYTTYPLEVAPGFEINKAIDGNSATFATLEGGQTLSGKNIFQLNARTTRGIRLTRIFVTVSPMGTSATAVMQGTLGDPSSPTANWINISNNAVLNAATVGITISTPNFYRGYRLRGISGTSSAGTKELKEIEMLVDQSTYERSLYPKVDCSDDRDGDGMLNHLDLDMDDDGCFDVYEAGFTQDKNLEKLSGAVNANGGITSHDYTLVPRVFYRTPGLRLCADTDGDGIEDLYDVDADNNGIYNYIESPNCFYNRADYASGDRRDRITVTTQLIIDETRGPIENVVDGKASGLELFIRGEQDITDKEMFRFSYPATGLGVEVTSLTLLSISNTWFAGSTAKLQGTNNPEDANPIWVDLSPDVTLDTSTKFTVDADRIDYYKKYRILGVSGRVNGSTASTYSIPEMTQTIGTFTRSLYPKPDCTDDLDGDAIPNHLDPDQDGDGCYDVFEAGFIDDTGATSLTGDITVLGAIESHDYDRIPDIYYNNYNLQRCIDTDGDGVVDLDDVDADNDGIYNHQESPGCFFTAREYEQGARTGFITATTGLNLAGGTAQSTIDGVAGTGMLIDVSQSTVGEEIFRLHLWQSLPGVAYASVKFSHDQNLWGSGGVSATLEATLDANASHPVWVALADITFPAQSTESVLDIPAGKKAPYKAYRLIGKTGSTYSTASNIYEITATVDNSTFDPSLNPKATCSDDMDGDGIPNHLDLDSDGDGCYDVNEAGFEDSNTDGILGGAGTVVVDDKGKVVTPGLTTGYRMPNLIFLDPEQNRCTGDGIVDPTDMCVTDDAMITNDYGLAQSGFHASVVRAKSGFMTFGSANVDAFGGTRDNNPEAKGIQYFPVKIESDTHRQQFADQYPIFASADDMLPRSMDDYRYKGEPIAISLAGSGNSDLEETQTFLLTTDGLYVWGYPALSIPKAIYARTTDLTNEPVITLLKDTVATGNVISATIKPNGVIPWSGIQRIPDDKMPVDETGQPILAKDIKTISAAAGMLSILTISGDVYIIFSDEEFITAPNPPVKPAAYGDGSTVRDHKWHKAQVQHVKSLRHSGDAGNFVALTQGGDLYTWGPSVYVGDNSEALSLSYPTRMTMPADFGATARPRMVAVASFNASTSAYMLLDNQGRLYSLGGNAKGVLGVGTSMNDLGVNSTLVWNRVKGANGVGLLENVKFVNMTAHDRSDVAVGAITNDGKVYLWGDTGYSRISDVPGNINTTGALRATPAIPTGVDTDTQNIIYVEPGGHVTPIVDKATAKFGYVGHLIRGSMGNGANGAGAQLPSYDFENTPIIDFCNLAVLGDFIPVNPMLRLPLIAP